jgi:hypothetical protein
VEIPVVTIYSTCSEHYVPLHFTHTDYFHKPDSSIQLKRTVLCAVRTEFFCSIWMNVSLQSVSVLVDGTFCY